MLVRTLAAGVPAEFEAWRALIAVLAAVTMTNLATLRQTNLKRLRAYSSIAQVGYLLMGVAALGSDELERYAGLGRAMPGAALALAISVLALAGFPPMGSYVGKAMLFAAAMRRDDEERTAPGRRVPPATTLAVSIAGLATLLAGVIPQPLLTLARHASRILDR